MLTSCLYCILVVLLFLSVSLVVGSLNWESLPFWLLFLIADRWLINRRFRLMNEETRFDSLWKSARNCRWRRGRRGFHFGFFFPWILVDFSRRSVEDGGDWIKHGFSLAPIATSNQNDWAARDRGCTELLPCFRFVSFGILSELNFHLGLDGFY